MPENPHFNIKNIRDYIVGVNQQVPLLDGSWRTYVNFDNAASTPSLVPVLDAVNDFAQWYSSVHRGTGYKSQVSTEVYDRAHEIVCRYVGANPEDHAVILVKNSTEALNKLARRLTPIGKRDIILNTLMEHHSNDLPWRKAAHLIHVGVNPDGSLSLEHLNQMLDRYADRVRLVAVTGASNVSGYLNPIHQIAEKAHSVGAQILVDAAQLAPHRAVSMGSLDQPDHIDYMVLSGHKMYAPYGSGALIGRRDTFLQGDPDMVGGGVVEIVTLDEVMWAGLPDKEEAGSPNVIGAVAMARAMQVLEEIGMDNLADHEAELTTRLLIGLNQMDRIQVLGSNDPARTRERAGVVPFAVDGMSHYQVAAILSMEGGIGVRNGCFCAHPYILDLLDVDPEEARKHQESVRQGSKKDLPGLVRVSFGCYNTADEVDWLLMQLEHIVRGEFKGKYKQDPLSGEYQPVGWVMPTQDAFSL